MQRYEAPPFPNSKGGTIQFVGVTREKAQYLDLETLARAAMAVD